MFDTVDTSDDRRMDFQEFKAAIPLLEQWGGHVPNPAAEFGRIDTDGGGLILFDEFSAWALKQPDQALREALKSATTQRRCRPPAP